MTGTIETGPAPLGHSGQARATRDERRTQVAAMLVAHVSVREMARLTGASKSTIDRDVQVIRRWWRQQAAQSYSLRVAEELGKLDELEKAVMPKARAGDVKAIEQAIRLMERRARVLGIDAPVRSRVEVITEDALDAAIRELEGQLDDGKPVATPADL